MPPLQRPRLTIHLICLDADDTLWGHESYFQASYRRFVDLLAPFADARGPRNGWSRSRTAISISMATA